MGHFLGRVEVWGGHPGGHGACLLRKGYMAKGYNQCEGASNNSYGSKKKNQGIRVGDSAVNGAGKHALRRRPMEARRTVHGGGLKIFSGLESNTESTQGKSKKKDHSSHKQKKEGGGGEKEGRGGGRVKGEFVVIKKRIWEAAVWYKGRRMGGPKAFFHCQGREREETNCHGGPGGPENRGTKEQVLLDDQTNILRDSRKGGSNSGFPHGVGQKHQVKKGHFYVGKETRRKGGLGLWKRIGKKRGESGGPESSMGVPKLKGVKEKEKNLEERGQKGYIVCTLAGHPK